MTYPQHPSPHPSDSCVLLSVRGVPSWVAVLIAIIGAALGMVAGHSDGQYTLGWVFGLIFTAGAAVATLAVRRGSLFTAMVQVPIVLTVVVVFTFKFLAGDRTLIAASKIVTSFPIMAIATGVALLLGLVRIIAQPLKGAGMAHHSQSDSAHA